MNTTQKNSVVTACYIIVSALWRLIPHWPNVTPFTALALSTGNMHHTHLSILIPLIPLAITDLFFGFHSTMPFVYGSLILIHLIGKKLQPKKPSSILIASLASSCIFFIITNFGAWLMSDLYPQTLGGLFTALTLGIPFYKNALLGDLMFSIIFFGGLSLLQPQRQENNHASAING